MEFWLSGSLLTNFFFFHDGILAIRKPFTNLSFFSRWNSGYQEAFHELSFSRWNSGYQEAFHELFLFFTMEFWLSGSLSRTFSFFHHGILEIRNLGEDSLYIYIYITKSIYTGSASLKILPLDLEPPLQGKEYGPPYSNTTKKVKAMLHLATTYFFPEITYRHGIQIFFFRTQICENGKNTLYYI
jgi:hypothetical protein